MKSTEKPKIDTSWVKTLDDCINFVINNQEHNQRELTKWGEMDENSALGMAHHSIGQWLRNTLGLWFEGPPVAWFNENGIYHADDMSSIILTSLHRKLNNKDIELKAQIKHYRNYWKKVNPKVNKGIKG